MSSTRPKVVVVMPAYNAARTLRMTYAELPHNVVDLVIVVDDGSSDETVEIARSLHDALENWRLERLSAIDRAVLRLAAVELMHLDDVPPKVAIQEGIRLAEQYGGPESPRFVNGVLDALYKRVAPRR